MKQLTLVRHAEAEFGGNTIKEDHARKLTFAGQRDAQHMSEFLMDTYWGHDQRPAILRQPDHMVVSDAQRTVETSHIFNRSLKLAESQISYDRRGYLASSLDLFSLILQFPNEWNHVILIGHNDGISELCEELLSKHKSILMPPSAVCILELPCHEWHDLGFNSARLIGYVTPQLIKKRFPENRLPNPIEG